MPFVGKRGDQNLNGRRFVSMRVKFAGALLVTGCAVLLAALLLIPLTWQIFRNFYMEEDRVNARLDAYMDSFSTYVAEEGIRSDDTAAVVKWTRLRRSVYLTVFHDTDENFGAAEGELWQGGDTPDMEPFFDRILHDESGEENAGSEAEGTLYTVRFADGFSSVAVVDYSHSTAYDIILMGGILIAMGVFFLVAILYYHSQICAIVALAQDVEAVSGGAMDAIIASDRNDEIGLLARDVRIMRDTVVEKMEAGERARQANSDLITSMTHDLRTPLTTLLGYMELLGNESETANLTDTQRSYIRVCTNKAEQIKELSDKLFLYFWAYTRPEDEGVLEAFDAGILFGQLIGDYIPAMEAAGLFVEADLCLIPEGTTVSVRPDCLRRVMDNLFDNLVKYASVDEAVRVTARMEDAYLVLCMTNAVMKVSEHVSGTRIGHKTCVNMMDLMHGSFGTIEREGHFTAELRFPISTV